MEEHERGVFEIVRGTDVTTTWRNGWLVTQSYGFHKQRGVVNGCIGKTIILTSRL